MLPRFAKGKFFPKNKEKYVGLKTPTYRSSWEHAFMRLCDEHPNVAKWASESIKIPYRHPFTGKYTVYVPDFFIAYTDRNGKTLAELIEVKPANQAIKEKIGRSNHNKASYIVNQAKWEAAYKWCKQNKIKFRVITENEIFHTGQR